MLSCHEHAGNSPANARARPDPRRFGEVGSSSGSMRRFLPPLCPVIRAPAQPPRHLPALPSALVVVAFCIIGASAMSPGDAPESSHLAASVARGLGVSRSSVPRDAGVYLVDSRSVLVTPVRGGPCGARRERVAAAYHGAEQGRGVWVRWQEGSGGAATCPEMGRLPSAGQGHAGSAPLLADPRREEQDGGAGTHDGKRRRKYHSDRGSESAPHRTGEDSAHPCQPIGPGDGAEECLPEVGRRGWVVLTRDRRMRYRAHERAALMQAGVRAFVLDVCFINTPPVPQRFSWERHVPEWLLEPGWSPAIPGESTGEGLTKWTSSGRKSLRTGHGGSFCHSSPSDAAMYSTPSDAMYRQGDTRGSSLAAGRDIERGVMRIGFSYTSFLIGEKCLLHTLKVSNARLPASIAGRRAGCQTPCGVCNADPYNQPCMARKLLATRTSTNGHQTCTRPQCSDTCCCMHNPVALASCRTLRHKEAYAPGMPTVVGGVMVENARSADDARRGCCQRSGG
jgi:hypothetical protein